MLTIKELKELYTKMTGLVSKGDTIPEVLDEIEQAYVNPQTAIEKLESSMANMFCFKKVYEKKGLTITEETTFDTDIKYSEHAGKVCMIRLENYSANIPTIIGAYEKDGGYHEITNGNSDYVAELNRDTRGENPKFTMTIKIKGTGLSNIPVSGFEIYFLENAIV